MIAIDPIDEAPIEQAGPINRANFIEFCHEMVIASKESDDETGSLLVNLDLSPTQIYSLDATLRGLDQGIHTFLYLKGRQVRVTTYCLALVIYWLQKYSGVKGLFIIDKNDRLVEHREIVEDMVNSLPSPKWRHPCTKFNNTMCKFSNRSQLSFLCANSRTKGALGSSIGSLVIHGSEMGLWQDEEGFNSLMASRSLTAPQRLILLEGRAFGMGLWHDMWVTACESTDQMAIFVGWWRHPLYAYSEDSQQYKVYWSTYPEYSPEEIVWVDAIWQNYHFKITPEQMAWWRCELRESMRGNLENMYENFPPTPEQAFRMGGRNFFNQERLLEIHQAIDTDMHREVLKPQYFAFRWGPTFEETEIAEVEPLLGGYDLTIWEPPPERNEGGLLHCMGIDPAYGVSAESDGSAIEIFRCYADGLDQVAEFYSRGRGLGPNRLCWALIYLASAYLTNSECYYNIELAGGGHAVEGEIERMRSGIAVGVPNKLGRKFGNFRPYLYSRPDSVRPSFSAKHYKATHELRELMLCDLQNYVETGLMRVRSRDLLEECALFQRRDNGDIVSVGTGTRFNDDRVMAAALGLQVYLRPILYFLGGTKFTRDRNKEEQRTFAGQVSVDDLINARVTKWYQQHGGRPSGSQTQR